MSLIIIMERSAACVPSPAAKHFRPPSLWPLAFPMRFSRTQAESSSMRCLWTRGFGSLDEESLNQAVKALEGLAGGNCMVGIISHVPELKERIERKMS